MRPCLDNKAMDARARDPSLCWFGLLVGGGGGLVECRVGVGHCRGQRPGEAWVAQETTGVFWVS